MPRADVVWQALKPIIRKRRRSVWGPFVLFLLGGTLLLVLVVYGPIQRIGSSPASDGTADDSSVGDRAEQEELMGEAEARPPAGMRSGGDALVPTIPGEVEEEEEEPADDVTRMGPSDLGVNEVQEPAEEAPQGPAKVAGERPKAEAAPSIPNPPRSWEDDWSKEIAVSTLLLQQNPRAANEYVNRGIYYCKSGNADKAIADFSEAIRLDPACARAYHNRGVAWILKRDFRQAVADFEQSLRLDPEYEDARVHRDLAIQAMEARE